MKKQLAHAIRRNTWGIIVIALKILSVVLMAYVYVPGPEQMSKAVCVTFFAISVAIDAWGLYRKIQRSMTPDIEQRRE